MKQENYHWTLPTSMFFCISLFVILLDQITKYLVRQEIPLGASIPIIDNILSFTNTTNTGASFSLFTEYSFLLSILAGIVIAAILIFYKKIPANYRLPFALILGGASGNLIDRIFFGTVTDFIDLHLWPVFNLADSAITVAAVLVVIIVWREK